LTSLPEPTPSEPSITQISGGEGFKAEDFESPPVPLHDDDDDGDDDVRILDQPSRPTAAIPNGGKKAQKRQKEAVVPAVPKKQKKEAVVANMMEKYLEVKTKHMESEAAEKSRAGSGADEYSIKNCISVINTMAGLITDEERAEALDVFKDAQNREIFMNADSTTRLIWIRKKWLVF
jgi:hypothetical protein